jgi:predicted RNA methylase
VPPAAGPDHLARLHETLLPAGERRARGAFYTPPAVARELATWALRDLDDPLVCDPACGGGAFLLAAWDAGARRLVGIDVDPLAIAVCEAVLWLAGATAELVVGDALLTTWPAGVDVVVGNPPFLGQLDGSTARTRDRAAAIGATGYVDEAAVFLAASVRHARRRVALLQPESVVSVAGAAAVRAEVGPVLHGLWSPSRSVFADTPVRVVGVLVDKDNPAGLDERWAPLLASARGVPAIELPDHGVVGDHATVVAGFRDEYYDLVPLVREAEPGDAPLVTSGLIDPARSLWGERSARFGRRRWDAPGIDPLELPAWAVALRVPKVLVATQTRVVEAVADPSGTAVPSTPVISVVAAGSLDVWHLLAVLLAPPVTAWALREATGAALSSDAVKLSAKQVRRIPLPPPGADWDDAARLAETGDVDGVATAMTRAYGADVLDWWRARLAYGSRDG